jgi:hypothetical protein
VSGNSKTADVRLYIALVHHPVVNKDGNIIASAVTNLDLHDIARAARTYGVRGFFVVTPLEDQKELVNKILEHWLTGHGSTYNPTRGEALGLVKVVSTLEAAIEAIEQEETVRPAVVATSSRGHRQTVSYQRMRQKLDSGHPFLLLFGTAWGLARTAITTADHVLDPVIGPTDYNHLSVRAAAGIILDRLLGQ